MRLASKNVAIRDGANFVQFEQLTTASTSEAAKLLGVPYVTASKFFTVSKWASEKIKAHLRSGEITLTTAYKDAALHRPPRPKSLKDILGPKATGMANNKHKKVGIRFKGAVNALRAEIISTKQAGWKTGTTVEAARFVINELLCLINLQESRPHEREDNHDEN